MKTTPHPPGSPAGAVGLRAAGLAAVAAAALVATARGQAPPNPAADVPASADPRLVVERFAAAPNVVHPIALDFDARGRLLVVESHTHFRPANYAGPKH